MYVSSIYMACMARIIQRVKTIETRGVSMYILSNDCGQSRSAFTNHSQEHPLTFSPRFANWNVTQFLIG